LNGIPAIEYMPSGEKGMNFLIILALRSILSSVIGSSFYKWFQNTKTGVWFQLKVDTFMEYLADKYNIEIAKKDAKWRVDYPLLAERVDSLEAMAHPDREAAFQKKMKAIDKRIKQLEKGN